MPTNACLDPAVKKTVTVCENNAFYKHCTGTQFSQDSYIFRSAHATSLSDPPPLPSLLHQPPFYITFDEPATKSS